MLSIFFITIYIYIILCLTYLNDNFDIFPYKVNRTLNFGVNETFMDGLNDFYGSSSQLDDQEIGMNDQTNFMSPLESHLYVFNTFH